MARIHINQWPTPIEAGRKCILDAALDAGVPYPHGCSVGECGSCKSHLISGEVKLGEHSPDALSEAEHASGVILACRAHAVSDVHLRWLASGAAPLPQLKFQAKVSHVSHIAHDVVLLRLTPPAHVKFNFRPGQFAKLRFANVPVRSYSMASQPGAAELEFHIRILPDGAASQYVANQIALNDVVDITGPVGQAYWDDPHGARSGQLLLLAGGTGMAPILSVLDAALSDGMPPEKIHVYHAVRGKRDLYAEAHLTARLSQHPFRFVPVLSTDRDDDFRYGLLHEALADDFEKMQNTRIYVAGPPPMVDAVVRFANERGIDANQVRADAFYAAPVEKKSLFGRLSTWAGLT
jgi:naphthalene 1,2-dioxygenase ferredoxin reductase component